MFFRFFITLLVCVVWAGVSSAQSAFITVTSAHDQKPLPGAHIFISPLSGNGKPQYEITDNKGQVKNFVTQPSLLKVSFMGFKSFTDTIFPGSPYSIALDEDQTALSTFVVTANSVPTRIEESVYKIRVIDRKRIESQGAMNLRDLLTNDLNIRLSQDAVLGSGLTMQGVGSENVKIMIDGVPVVGRLDGNIDISQITLQNIEKIEIIEGPSSVTYGSNALGGVINLITQKNQNHSVEGNLQAYYETVGNYNFDGQIGYKHKKHTLQIGGGRYFFDGFSRVDTIKRVQTWKPKEQYFASLSYGISLGKMNLRYSGNFFHEIIQAKGTPEAPFYISATDQYFRTIRTTHSLMLNGYVAKNHHLDITASYSYYNRRRQTFRKDLVTLDQTFVDENTDEFNQIMSRGIYSFVKPNARIGLQAGYDINVETAEGQRILDKYQWMGDFAFFTSAEFRFFKKRNFIIKPAMRFGYNTKFSMPVIPALHLKYTPLKGLDIRLSYARGFRAPSLKELYFVFVDVNHNLYGNTNLQAESSNNITGSISYNGEKNKFRYGVSVNGFYNDIHNQIRSVIVSITPDSNIYRNENVSRFQSAGGGVNVSFGYQDFNIGLGATYTGVQNYLGDSLSSGNRFAFYPEFQSNASYFFRWWNGQLSIFFKYSGRQPFLYTDIDPDTQQEVIREGYVEGWGTLDVTYTQNLFKKRLQIGLFGKNLLNITDVRQTLGGASGSPHSTGSTSLPTMWGASFGVSLKYNFIVH